MPVVAQIRCVKGIRWQEVFIYVRSQLRGIHNVLVATSPVCVHVLKGHKGDVVCIEGTEGLVRA